MLDRSQVGLDGRLVVDSQAPTAARYFSASGLEAQSQTLLGCTRSAATMTSRSRAGRSASSSGLRMRSLRPYVCVVWFRSRGNLVIGLVPRRRARSDGSPIVAEK